MTLQRPYNTSRYVGDKPDPSTGVVEDVWPGPTATIPLVDDPVELEIVSADAANSAGGTGLRQAKLDLLLPDFSFLPVFIELDGLTPVQIPNGPFLRCNRGRGIAAGSFGKVQGGAVDVRETGGGPVWARFQAGTNETRGAHYTVPRRIESSVTNMEMRLYDRKPADVVEVEFKVRILGGIWFTVGLNELNEIEASFIAGTDDQNFGQTGTDVKVEYVASGSPGRLVANFIVHEYAVTG